MSDATPPQQPVDPNEARDDRYRRAVEAVTLDVTRWRPPARREYVRPIAYSPGTMQTTVRR